MPADSDVSAAMIEAGEEWRLDAKGIDPDAQAVVWGRAPKLSMSPSGAAAAYAIRREAALVRLRTRPPKGFTVTGIHRLAPPELDPASARGRLRTALLSGAVVELWRSPTAFRVLDAIARDTGAEQPVRRFRRASGGAMLAPLHGLDGSQLFLRAAEAGSVGDPARAGDALELLASSSELPVPRLVARGITGRASWTAETGLPGRRPRTLNAAMALNLASLCAKFPLAKGTASGFRADVDVIATNFPEWADALSRVATKAESRLSSLPAVVCHGDLWAGNLLTRGDAITGIVDWDSWTHAGVPGTDLLNAFATQQRLRKRGTVGHEWMAAPWRIDAFSSLARPYWRALGVGDDRELIDDVGLAWWAQQIAAHIRRYPPHVTWPEWVEDNVGVVVRALARR